MKNNPIETMHHEHDVICNTESIIRDLDKYWEVDVEQYKDKIQALVKFFREYADEFHHRKEEQILFPEIMNHPDFVLHDIIDEFEQHHDDFRDYLVAIEEALAEKDFVKSYSELNKYLQDLLDHIGAENDELFVLAETLMTEDELETIYFKFKDIDMELGEEKKIELEKMITTFGETK